MPLLNDMPLERTNQIFRHPIHQDGVGTLMRLITALRQCRSAKDYPDVRPALTQLRRNGLWIALAGNQTAKAGSLLRKLDLPVDAIATSAEWGVAKPDPAFFRRVIELSGVAPNELLYVGDHRDNDVVAGHAAGLWTALIRRGPWGHLWADDPTVLANADWVINSLNELPNLIART
ncbi:HAD family hydrolase [Amycolatopsis solani]|uniref:HAD family hydrolase n=1 Tax=Amycolatopsis solani TaxID=3028615 RepID=UPI0025B1FE61|nr:HAD family hydrolase [Amycolatopsis sp. MEP2-6]